MSDEFKPEEINPFENVPNGMSEQEKADLVGQLSAYWSRYYELLNQITEGEKSGEAMTPIVQLMGELMESAAIIAQKLFVAEEAFQFDTRDIEKKPRPQYLELFFQKNRLQDVKVTKANFPQILKAKGFALLAEKDTFSYFMEPSPHAGLVNLIHRTGRKEKK